MYADPDDFRIATLAEYCSGLELGDAVEDVLLIETIARMSERIDHYTGTTWEESPDEVPSDIRRATALLVWDHYKAESDTLRRAEAWDTPDARFTRSRSKPTGIPEADLIIARFSTTDASSGGFSILPIVKDYDESPDLWESL